VRVGGVDAKRTYRPRSRVDPLGVERDEGVTHFVGQRLGANASDDGIRRREWTGLPPARPGRAADLAGCYGSATVPRDGGVHLSWDVVAVAELA
jgi:hypothetical protein